MCVGVVPHAIMIKIREYVPADQSAAKGLIELGLGEHFGLVDSSLNPDLLDIHASYVASGGRFFVAESGGVLVGTVGLVFSSDRLQMVRLSIHPTYRRRGIASALLDHCIEMTQLAGRSQLVAHTQPEWESAMGFYLRHGFKPYGSDDIDVHLARRVGPG